MGDRRSFFRFWSSSAPTSRRSSSAQPAAPPRITTSPAPPKPKPKPKSSSSSPSPSREASKTKKPNQSSSPSRPSPKSKSTPNASPSRKDSQTPSTSQRASPSRSPKPEAHEQDREEHQKTVTTTLESNIRDEIETEPSKSPEFDTHQGHEKQSIDKEDSSNEQKPSMEVIKASSEEIEEVKGVVREETNGLPRNDEMAKQETVHDDQDSPDPKHGKITTSPSKDENTSDMHKRSVRANGKVGSSHKDNILNFVNHVMQSKEGSGIEPLASVIILAGENRGASLQMGSSKGREGLVHIHRGYKTRSDHEVFKENTDEEESAKLKKTNDTKVMEDQQQPETYVNNNTQGINNSIVLNSSVTEKSPGVHLTIAQVPNEDAKESKEKGIFTESKKAEFSVNRAENLVHEPRIRRRCLKGLMLETSDSDEEENPDKPRRHGCRVACKEAAK